MRWIRETSEDELQIDEGTLYPALHRLEDRAVIEAEWGVSENNRLARSSTARGWERHARAVGKMLAAEPAKSR